MVKRKTGVATLLLPCGRPGKTCNASGGAGLIEPAPFQDDTALAAIKLRAAERLSYGQSLTATTRGVLSTIRPGRRNDSSAEPRNK